MLTWLRSPATSGSVTASASDEIGEGTYAGTGTPETTTCSAGADGRVGELSLSAGAATPAARKSAADATADRVSTAGADGAGADVAGGDNAGADDAGADDAGADVVGGDDASADAGADTGELGRAW